MSSTTIYEYQLQNNTKSVDTDNLFLLDANCGGSPTGDCPNPKQYWRNGARYTTRCRRSDCKSEECRRKYNHKQAEILKNEARINKYSFWGTMKFIKNTKQPSEKEYKSGIRKVQEAIRQKNRSKKWKKQGKSIQLQWRPHFTTSGVDYNYVIWTTGFRTWRTLKRYLRPIFQEKFQEYKFRFYLRPPENIVAVSNYVHKNMKNIADQVLPPKDWRHKRKTGGCRMPSGRSKKDIWNEIRQSWFEPHGILETKYERTVIS